MALGLNGMQQDILSDDEIKPAYKKRERKPPKKITESYLHNSGLAYLQRFPASTAHFRAVMKRKIDRSCRHHTDQNREDSAQMLETVIGKFQTLGLLNDEGYLRGMVTSLRRRGLSAAAILSKLSAKGLPANDIRAALGTFDSESMDEQTGDIAAALRMARRKRLGSFRTPGKPATPEKDLATLARAGFGYDVAKKALSFSTDD